MEVEPGAAPYLRPFVGAEELINGGERYILYLADAGPEQLRRLPNVRNAIAAVRAMREASSSAPTRALAKTPMQFHVTVVPDQPFLAIPKVSSERRDYAPICWLEPPTVPSDLVFVLAEATIWHFAMLTSTMHMAWLRRIGGRLESRYRYSIGLVYNTFPWPEASSISRSRVEAYAQAVLDVRASHPLASLADLYDPDTMPNDLRNAHVKLDTAIERLYRSAPFTSDQDRVEHLFGLYEAMVNPLEREGARQNRLTARRVSRAVVVPDEGTAADE